MPAESRGVRRTAEGVDGYGAGAHMARLVIGEMPGVRLALVSAHQRHRVE